MYTHMMKQRTRALGRGFWGDKLAQQKLEAAKAAKQRESGTKAVADASWASGTKSGGGEGARKRA